MMSSRWLILLTLLSGGCQTVSLPHLASRGQARGTESISGGNGMPSCFSSAASGGAACDSVTCASAPCQPDAETCREIHVTAPRQKVHVPAQAPSAPAGQQQLVEQQIAQTRQVILVPQQVYVPFVQATNFSAVRVNGLQQTQFINAQGILTQATGGVAAGQAVGAASQFGVGTQSVEGTGAARAITSEEAQRCQEELKAAKAAIDNLEAQVEMLKKALQR